jgi:glycosyltransferase involved in cell wall biosynthesis
MKVAIISVFKPSKGGISEHVYHLSRHLIKENIQVHIIARQVENAPLEEEVEGIYVHRYKYPDFLIKYHLTFLSNLFLICSCLSTIRKIDQVENFDLIHGHYAYSDGFMAAIYKRIFKKCCVLTVHGNDLVKVYDFKSNFANILFNFFKTTIEKFTVRTVDQIIFVSDSLKNTATSWRTPLNKLNVIPNGVDEKYFYVPRNPTSNLTLFTLRQHVDKNGLIFAIRAMKYVTDKYPDSHLFILGDGPLKQELMNETKALMLENNVSFEGYVTGDRFDLLFSSTRIMLVPSKDEGFGIVVLEGMAAGIPVIASNVGGIPEIITDHKNGILVPPQNPKMIADAVFELASNEELYDKISINGKSRAKEFSWDKFAKETIDVYSKCLNN